MYSGGELSFRFPVLRAICTTIPESVMLTSFLLPSTAKDGASRIVSGRALRGFADGFISVVLASYLSDLGFSAIQVGAIVTATLLGSAALTLAVGLAGGSLPARRVLLGATLLMAATGLGFAGVTAFWPLLVIAFAGTLNPSAGDVSIFLPTEQALLATKVESRQRTALFARYTLGATLAGALGALCSGIPVLMARHFDVELLDAQRGAFLLYTVLALGIGVLYRGIPAVSSVGQPRSRPLAESRRVVFRLSALFSLDSLGGGFVVQSLLALWLFERFDLSLGVVGAVFFVAGLLSASSQLASPWLADRIGLIRTMAFTHLPANTLLIAAALIPNAPLAIALLLARMALSQMDVPARQSYVMAVVPPEERAAAASVTNVPRSLAAALTPLLAGVMLSQTSFGWPLVAGGALKILYDLLLFQQFRSLRPPEEQVSGTNSS